MPIDEQIKIRAFWNEADMAFLRKLESGEKEFTAKQVQKILLSERGLRTSDRSIHLKRRILRQQDGVKKQKNRKNFIWSFEGMESDLISDWNAGVGGPDIAKRLSVKYKKKISYNNVVAKIRSLRRAGVLADSGDGSKAGRFVYTPGCQTLIKGDFRTLNVGYFLTEEQARAFALKHCMTGRVTVTRLGKTHPDMGPHQPIILNLSGV